MDTSEFRIWALRGAERRLAEIAEETRAIYAAFPELRGALRARPANPYTAGVRQAIQGAVTRRRPKLSAAARKRIAAAQRKRWAEWRNKRRGAAAAKAAGPNTARGKRSWNRK